MNKKHTLMFLVLSLILISLSCVNAVNDTVYDVDESVSEENTSESSDSFYHQDNIITKDVTDNVKEDSSKTYNIKNSEDLYNVLDSAEDLTGKHIVELMNKELIVNKEFYVFNDNLELIFNGNGNQLTLHDTLSFNVKNVTFNNLIIEFDDNIDTRDIIDNYGNMNLNNVTIKNTLEYNYMVNVFKENGYYDFDDWDGVDSTFSYSTNSMNLNNKGKLCVNNSHFINNSGYEGASIYNDGTIIVENTTFEDSMAKYGIICSNNASVIKNCEFKNNRVLQQLILTDGNSELINNTFTNNIVAGSSILDNRGSINIKNCNFTNNNVKYDLVDNWVYMDASNLYLSNNTCEVLINSFGNLTLKDSFIKDNTCTRAIICRDTLHAAQTDDIDKAGNVTLTGNKIFRANVEFTDFLNNEDIGLLSLYNNTVYDKPDYMGDCVFEGNLFIEDKDLYDDEGNYHGIKKEIKIGEYINYELVAGSSSDEYPVKTNLTLNPIYEKLFLGNSLNITGTLTDINDNPISNKTIVINIYGGESDFGIYSYEFNTTTDEKGIYSYQHKLDDEGAMNIDIFFRDEGIYEYSEKHASSYVGQLETIISLDPMASTANVGENLIISGNLTDTNNEILPNVNLYINLTYEDHEQSIIKYVKTDDNGKYAFNYTPDSSGKLNIRVHSNNYFVMSYPECSIIILDNIEVDNNTSDNNSTDNKDTGNEKEIDDQINTSDNTKKYTKHQTRNKIINTYKTEQKQVNKSFQKISDKIILNVGTYVRLSWLNDIFNDDFKNKTLLIYIDDILVFNGTISDNPSEVLFEIIEKYEGEHLLKVVVDNNIYQKEVIII